MDKDRTKKRLNALLNLTAKEPGLVYLSSCGAKIILIRGGSVLKVTFALESMASFLAKMREPAAENHTTTSAHFSAYIQGLMCTSDAERNII